MKFRVTYTNLLLTIIAVMLFCQVAMNLMEHRYPSEMPIVGWPYTTAKYHLGRVDVNNFSDMDWPYSLDVTVSNFDDFDYSRLAQEIEIWSN